jgi:hypothetical protein
MAALPLNVFKTKTSILGSNTTTFVYTAPVGVTSIILMANVANVTQNVQYVTMSHYRNLPVLPDSQGNGGQPGNVVTEIAKSFGIPGDNSANMLQGKLIIESLDSVIAYANNTSTCKLVLSVLETANA